MKGVLSAVLALSCGLVISCSIVSAQDAQFDACLQEGIKARNAQDYAEAEKAFSLAKDEALKKGKSDWRVGRALYELGDTKLAAGKFADAIPLYEQALSIYAKPGTGWSFEGTVAQQLGFAYYSLGKYKEAEAPYRQAVRFWEKQNGVDHVYCAAPIFRAAQNHLAQGKYAEAESEYKRAISLYEKSPDNQGDLCTATFGLWELYTKSGQTQKAEVLFRQLIPMTEKAAGGESKQLSDVLFDTGKVLVTQERWEEAEPLARRAMTIAEKINGPESVEAANCRVLLAGILWKLGARDTPEAYTRKALAIYEKLYGPEHSGTARLYRNFADTLYHQYKYAEAETMYRKSLAYNEKFAPGSPEMVADLLALYVVCDNQKKTQEAEEFRRRADELKRNFPGSGRLDSARGLLRPQLPTNPTSVSPINDKWALVIGISKFKDPSINLKYAAKDANDFRDFLVGSENFKADHVKILTDQEATRESIITQLGDGWLGKVAKPGDLVVIYMSSHGSTSREVGVNFLLAWDTNKNALTATGIPMQWLSEIIKEQVHCDRVLIFIDVCHSGAATATASKTYSTEIASAGGLGSKGLKRNDNFDVEKVKLGMGQAMLCSSLADQVSWESKRYQNSVFTRKLIEALKRKGETTKLTEAYDKLRSDVEVEVLRDRGELQSPVLNMSSWQGDDPALAVTPASPRPVTALPIEHLLGCNREWFHR